MDTERDAIGPHPNLGSSGAAEPTLIAPPGLKGLIVADTAIGDVRGSEGFFHYRGHDATEIAATRSFEAVTHLLLHGALPSRDDERAMQQELAAGRALPADVVARVTSLADAAVPTMAVLRAALSIAVDPTPVLDLDESRRRRHVVATIAMLPTLVAAIHRRRLGLDAVGADPRLGHAAAYLQLLSGSAPDPAHAQAVERYLSLTADHGFNASTFTARVVTSTGADVGAIVSAALAALSGPLHGGAPARVLDMLDEIGDPAETERWARRRLEAGHKIMGFGHAVYRAEDPRSRLLRRTALDLGGSLVERAVEIETRMLALLRGWKPDAVIVTNVEYYAALVLHLAGVPQSLFTPTFATSRVVGWGAHLLEQASVGRIIRPAARYSGPPASAAAA